MAQPFTVTVERDASGTPLRARVGVALIDDYLRYLATIGRSPTTWTSYAYDLAVFCRWLAERQPDGAIEAALCSLTPAEVLAFVEHQFRPREDRPALAAVTVYRRVVALAKFFDWAEANGLVGRNPVPRERPSRFAGRRRAGPPAFLRVPTPLPRPAPADELATFAATLRTWRDRALVALLVGAGLRLAEALGLRLGDLDWGGKQVFVRRGKGGHQRYAMAPEPAWAALKAYLDAERPAPPAGTPVGEAPVFVVLHGPRRGRALSPAGVQSIFRHHRRRALAPNVTPHRLRHTCGTELHRSGMPLEFVQEQLGHRRIESTRRYVHLSNGRLRAAYLEVEPRLYRAPADEEAH
jgi:integrase/recombinase XerD